MLRIAIAGLLAAGLALDASAGELRRSVPVTPGGMLEIRLDLGSVEVSSHDENAVEVEATAEGWRSDNVRFELSQDGNDVRLVAERHGLLPLLAGPVRVRVRVRLPERYSLSVRTGGGAIELDEIGGWVRAHTSGGAIELDGADGPVELRTSGGSIRAENVRGDLLARTSGGWIRVDDAGGRVEARTSGGEIRLADVTGPVRAHTSGGSISVRFRGAPEGEVETSGGSIEAEFPAEYGTNLEARTSGGRVRVEPEVQMSGAVTASEIVGRINGGGAELRLRTSGGNVRVRTR